MKSFTSFTCNWFRIIFYKTASFPIKSEFYIHCHLNNVKISILKCYLCKFIAAAAAKSLQSCTTLCDPIDSSLPGSSVPGILQARTLEWVAIAFSEIYWFTLYQVFYFTDLLITYFPILPHFVLWSFGLIIWSLITCNIYFLGSKRLLLQSDYLCCFLTLSCFCSWFSYFFMWNCIILHLKTFFFLVFAYLALVLGKYDLKCN